jgi:hypothetical protein
MAKAPETRISYSDAIILALAVFGILFGLSYLSFEAAVVVGILVLTYVVMKLLTT